MGYYSKCPGLLTGVNCSTTWLHTLNPALNYARFSAIGIYIIMTLCLLYSFTLRSMEYFKRKKQVGVKPSPWNLYLLRDLIIANLCWITFFSFNMNLEYELTSWRGILCTLGYVAENIFTSHSGFYFLLIIMKSVVGSVNDKNVIYREPSIKYFYIAMTPIWLIGITTMVLVGVGVIDYAPVIVRIVAIGMIPSSYAHIYITWKYLPTLRKGILKLLNNASQERSGAIDRGRWTALEGKLKQFQHSQFVVTNVMCLYCLVIGVTKLLYNPYVYAVTFFLGAIWQLTFCVQVLLMLGKGPCSRAAPSTEGDSTSSLESQMAEELELSFEF